MQRCFLRCASSLAVVAAALVLSLSSQRLLLFLFLFFQIYFVEFKKNAQNSAPGLDAGVEKKWVLTQILFHPSLMNNLK